MVRDMKTLPSLCFAVSCGHFQSVTICHRLTSFFRQSLLELVPILPGGLKIRLLREHLNDVHDRKPPGFGFCVIDATDFVAFEDGEVFIHVVRWSMFKSALTKPPSRSMENSALDCGNGKLLARWARPSIAATRRNGPVDSSPWV